MKQASDYLQINMLGDDEQQKRLGRVREGMRAAGIGAALIRSNANIYYLTGRVFRGFIYIMSDAEAPG